jgi:hypothetical protein
VFTDHSALSGSEEVVRRLLSPLHALRVNQEVNRSGKALFEQAVDLAFEKFAVYVPPHAPPSGFSLLVFVSPFREELLPQQWTATLDRHGMIFVSAANSGNDANRPCRGWDTSWRMRRPSIVRWMRSTSMPRLRGQTGRLPRPPRGGTHWPTATSGGFVGQRQARECPAVTGGDRHALWRAGRQRSIDLMKKNRAAPGGGSRA